MSVTINGTNGLTFNDASTQTTAATGFGFKNRIINGAMVIDQRNAGASVTISTGDTYTLDRYLVSASISSKISSQQSTTAPTGFINSLLITSLAATTPGSSDQFRLEQKIEGLNCTDLAWGTANAVTVTLSFWVRSSLTGTFGGAIVNSAGNRSYPFSFTISSANTFEQKTITIPGDATGTWLTTNGIGIVVRFSLGVGSTFQGTANTWAAANYIAPTGATNLVATNGATIYITGVQLEKGSTATSFDYRPYGTELALCQRYCQYAGSGAFGSFDGSTTTIIQITEKCVVPMRAAPSGAIFSGVSAAFRATGSDITNASPVLANFTSNASNSGGTSFWTQVTGFTGGTANTPVTARNNQSSNGGNFIILTSEL